MIVFFLLEFINAQLIASNYYDSSPIVPMSEYKNVYRTLSCWECFEAQGKMCIDRNYLSMISITGSSNSGHGICCKTESAEFPCVSSDSIICSEPAKNSQVSAILTADGSNYSMFSFCPAINQEVCGISDKNTNIDMNLTAQTSKQTI